MCSVYAVVPRRNSDQCQWFTLGRQYDAQYNKHYIIFANKSVSLRCASER